MLIFVLPEHVQSIRAPSERILATRLRGLEDHVTASAYLVEVADRPAAVHVFGHLRMERLLKEARAEGFTAGAVARLFLAGEPAVRASADRLPSAPGYVPAGGGVWVPRSDVAVAVVAPAKARSRRRRRPSVRAVRDAVAAALAVAFAVPDEVLGGLTSKLRRSSGGSREPPDRGLSRTPHLELDPEGALLPSTRFTLAVYCDDRPAFAGQSVMPVALELAPGIEQVVVDVWIAASPHFDVENPTGELTLHRDVAASERLTFAARVVDSPPPGDGRLTAVFTYEGRTRGQVTATVPIAGGDTTATDAVDAPRRRGAGTPAAPPGPPRAGPRVRVTEGDRRPHVTVEVVTVGLSGEYAVRVVTDAVAGRERSVPEPWPLPSATPELVTGYMQRFAQEGLSTEERRSRLVGVGMELWNVAPRRFKELYWQLTDDGGGLGSVLIVSQEPAFPWELVVPHRGTGRRRIQHQPLGVTAPIGRYIAEDMVAPDQPLDLEGSWVLAPVYRGRDFLKHAEAEATFVCEHFGGERITPGVYGGIEAAFERRAVALFHLACHGKLAAGAAQAVLLEEEGELMSEQIAAMPALAAAVGDREPLVFVNACEVGRMTPSLLGAGGFAVAFLGLGARGVIAPLWEVEDEVAHEFAMEFYARLLSDSRPAPARIVSDLRARAYEEGGADTWAAYCYFGDPDAALL